MKSDRPEYPNVPKLEDLSEEKVENGEQKNISTIASNLKSSNNTKSNRLVVVLDKNQNKHSERFMEGHREGDQTLNVESDCITPELGMRPKKKYIVVKQSQPPAGPETI